MVSRLLLTWDEELIDPARTCGWKINFIYYGAGGGQCRSQNRQAGSTFGFVVEFTCDLVKVLLVVAST